MKTGSSTPLLFVAGAGAFLLWTLFATTIISPIVIDDEVHYLLTAIAGPRLAEARAMGAAVQPSGALLYPELLHAIRLPGVSLETGAKLLNALLFTVSACALAWVAAPPPQLSKPWVTAALLATPLGCFAAYVMPECLYFALMAGVVFVFVRRSDRQADLGSIAFAGAIVGAATVVKPHGLLAVIALLAALLAATRDPKRCAVAMFVAALGAAVSYLAMKTLSTPPGLAGSDLLGPEYRAQLMALAAGPKAWVAGLRLAFIYLCAVLTVIGPAAVMLTEALWRTRLQNTSDQDRGAWLAGLWSLVLLLELIVAVPLVLSTEVNQTHLRYLDFLFPIVLALAARLSPGPDIRVVRLAAVIWAGAALVLLVASGHLRPLASAAPDLFFLYAGREFGAFGLRAAAPLFLICTVLAGALAMASGRVRWANAQAAVLIAFAMVAIPNAWSFDTALSTSMAADRAVGKAARVACGHGPQDVVGLGSPTNFVPLYAALTMLRRPAPLLRSDDPEIARAKMPAGTCLLTTLTAPEPRWVQLASSPSIRLLRAR